MEDQPTGTTEVSVSKEQAAEAEQDAEEQEETSLVEQLISLPEKSTGRLEELRNLLSDKSLVKIAMGEEFKHIDVPELRHLQRLTAETMKKWKAMTEAVDKSKDTGNRDEARKLIGELRAFCDTDLYPLLRSIGAHERDAIQSHADQPMQGPEASEYGVEAQDSERAQSKPVKRPKTPTQTELDNALNDAGEMIESFFSVNQIEETQGAPLPRDLVLPSHSKEQHPELRKQYEDLYNAYAAAAERAGRVAFVDVKEPRYESGGLSDPSMRAGSPYEISDDYRTTQRIQRRGGTFEINYGDASQTEAERIQAAIGKGKEPGPRSPGAGIDYGETIRAMRQELKHFGLWKKSLANAKDGVMADPKFGHRALTKAESAPGKLDGVFVKKYKNLIAGVVRADGKKPREVKDLVKYADPERYTPQPDEVEQKLHGYTDKQLDTLMALFDETTGLLHEQFGAKESFQYVSPATGKRSNTRRRGKSTLKWLKDYATILGGMSEQELKALETKLGNTNALYDQLDLMRRNIAKSVFPMLQQLGGDKGVRHALYKLKHWRLKDHQQASRSPTPEQKAAEVEPTLGSPSSMARQISDETQPADDHRSHFAGQTLDKDGIELVNMGNTQGGPRPFVTAGGGQAGGRASAQSDSEPSNLWDESDVDREEEEPYDFWADYNAMSDAGMTTPAQGQQTPVSEAMVVSPPPGATSPGPATPAQSVRPESGMGRSTGTPVGTLRKPKPIRPRARAQRTPSPQLPQGSPPPMRFRPIVAIASGTRLQIKPNVAGKKIPHHGRAPRVKFEASPRAPSPAEMERLRRHNLSVETVYKGAERNTSYTHLIDGDLAPVGRVHLVKMGNAVGDQRDNHILTQMDADANMGAKNLLQRSRRGPFKRSSGRSRIMAKTAHVSYRRRNGALEITVRRGINEQEMDTLLAKLGAHRLSTRNSYLYIIKGGSKKKIAALAQVKLENLRLKIIDCLAKYSTIGLLVQDTYEKGALHKGYSHGMEMVESMRKMPGLFATN